MAVFRYKKHLSNYRDTKEEDQTVMWSLYLCTGNPYNDKTESFLMNYPLNSNHCFYSLFDFDILSENIKITWNCEIISLEHCIGLALVKYETGSVTYPLLVPVLVDICDSCKDEIPLYWFRKVNDIVRIERCCLIKTIIFAMTFCHFFFNNFCNEVCHTLMLMIEW